jgi:transposase
VSESAAIKLVRRARETGSTAPARICGYRKPLLAGHEALLRQLTAAQGTITLAEIQAVLLARSIEAGCLSTIWSTLRRLGLAHKQTA